MTRTEVMIEASGLHCRYGSHEVLRGVQLAVRRGEVYALLGGNGAGKSTLLHAILGFVAPAAGQVSVVGHDVSLHTRLARSQIAYVPENVALYEQLSARENMHYLLGLAGLDPKSMDIERALDEVGFEASARDRRLGSYSKGMRQRVALALAVARKAPVLLLDEPSSGLDPRAIEELNELIIRLKQQGVAVLMATHDLLAAAQVADRVGFMKDGVLTEEAAAVEGRLDVRALQARFSGREVRP
jgi:ABC-2 type transport system ATP-binding protein